MYSVLQEYIDDILAYVQLIPDKVTQLKGRLSQYFIRLQARMHAHSEVSRFSQNWNSFEKYVLH